MSKEKRDSLVKIIEGGAQKTKVAKEAARAKSNRKAVERAEKEGGRPQDYQRSRLLIELEGLWRGTFKHTFPDYPQPSRWGGPERGRMTQLLERYDYDVVVNLVNYIFAEWKSVSSTFKKGPLTPTLGWVLALHDTFVPQATMWGKYSGLLAEWRAWWKANPNKQPPDELLKRYRASEPEMRRLGLI